MKYYSIIIFFFSLQINADVIKIATLEWHPYVSSDLRSGSSAEIIKAAFKAVGHEVKFEFLPWIRGLKYVESGRLDAITPVYFNKERESFMYFSSPFQFSPLVLYRNKKTQITYKTVKDLENYSLGLVNGYKNTTFIDSSTKIRKSFVQKDISNLKKLASNQIDLIAIDELVAKLLIVENPKQLENKLEMILPILDNKGLHVGFSRNSLNGKRYYAEFEKGLKLISSRINSIIKKNNLKFGIK